MKKRILSLLLAFVMVLTTIPVTALAAVGEVTTKQEFKDIKESDWFHEAVMKAVEDGIFSGVSKDSFDPYGSMNRSMYVTILGRIVGIDTANYISKGEFSDVNENAWYAPYVAWAVTNNITSGVGGGKFAPNDTVTREQMAVFTLRYFESAGIDYGKEVYNTQPSDIENVSDWAKVAVLKLWKAGLFQGNDGNFNPKKNATRAEAAVFGVRINDTVDAHDAAVSEKEKKEETTTSTGSNSNNHSGGHNSNYCTVNFVTNGGDAVSPLRLTNGETLYLVPTTQKNGYTFIGWYMDAACTTPFYQSDAITSNMNLYAKYEEMEKQQQLLDDTFVLNEQQPDLTFTVNSSKGLSNEALLELMTLEIMDNTVYVELNISGGNGTYIVSAAGGFTPGSTYKLTLGESLNFGGKEDSYRTCSFDIHKEEVINLKLNDELKYISSTSISNIKRNTENVDSLSVALVGNDDIITGTFTYDKADQLSLGNLLCVYTGTNPNERDVSTDYSGESVAYVKVKSISGTTVTYESIDEEESESVLFMPDTLPINISGFVVDELKDGEFNVDNSALDFKAFTDMGFDDSTTVDEGDFLVFYNGSMMEADSYGKVTSVYEDKGSTTIEFITTTIDEIQASMDYYTKDNADGEDMLKGADVAMIEAQIEKQALESGFAQAAMAYLGDVATKTDGFTEAAGVESFVLSDENGKPLTTDELELLWKKEFSFKNDQGITVTAEIGDEVQNLENGVRVALKIEGEFSVDVGEENEVKIKMEATFVEEVSIAFTANGGAVWGWKKKIFPYIKDYKMNATVDVYDFTGVSLNVHIMSKEKNEEGSTDFTDFDVTAQLKELLSLEDQEEMDAGVQNLFEMYGEMLETETDYITIVDQSIVDTEAWVDPFFIIAYRFKIDFVIKANLNIMLGANMEYMSGTRYNFWFGIKSKKAGSNSSDLMDESFAFQFYVMGTLGLKAGLEFEFAVGLFSTKAASIGLTAEFGPYVELYGYFIYEYYKLRGANTPTWAIDEQMMGALYLEFGIYLETTFKAQAGNGKYTYQPTLYENQWPLLWAGTQLNVYDFAYEVEEEEVYVMKDITSVTLPESYRNMSRLDLKEGDLTEDEYPLNKYYYMLSNKNFEFDSHTGDITVNVSSDVQYMECDLTLIWKMDKLAFSKNDLTSTIHLVWTSLNTDELKQKYAVSVKVGNNNDGYTTVWSNRVSKKEQFELPSKSDIETLIGYDINTVILNGSMVDLKYASCEGYDKELNLTQSVIGDTVYIFEVDEREYNLTVNDVQNTDGSTANRSFTSTYGKTFDLSLLVKTGTNNNRLSENAYTAYLNTTCSNENAKEVTDVINRDFAVQLLGDVNTYRANYVDNSCTVTYDFVTNDGVTIPEQNITIAKNSIPSSDYTNYLLNQGGGYMIASWDKKIGKVSGNTTFTANCISPEGELYKITFNINGGSLVDSMQRYAGGAITVPKEPTKIGYTFSGWYADEAWTQAYAFTNMPAENITVYAKWTANEYTVTFNAGVGTLADGENSKTVTYDSIYGTLPKPISNGNLKFRGWFTSTNDDVQVTTQAVVSITENQTFYAQYKMLEAIPDILETEPLTLVYDGKEKSYIIKFVEGSTPIDGFTVTYRKVGADSYEKTAVNAGTYFVRIKRQEDNTYAEYEKTINDALIIEKAVRDVFVPVPTINSTTFSAITVNPVPVPNDDGIMEYMAMYETNKIEFNGYTYEFVHEKFETPWTTSCTIPDLSANTEYSVFAKVSGGSNYEDAITTSAAIAVTSIASTAKESRKVDWKIHTGTKSGAGTDAKVYGTILYADGSRSGRTHFDGPGNDFQNNDTDTYGSDIYRAPWMVSGFNIGNNGDHSGSKWLCDYVQLTILGKVNKTTVKKTFDDSYADYKSDFWKRQVSSVGSFGNWGNEYDVNGSSKGNLTLSYDGTVTDQYYKSYNAYGQYDAPDIRVKLSDEVNLDAYGHCFYYSNYEFVVDQEALYDTMEVLGDDSVTFNISLNFNERSTTADTATKTQIVTITKQ